MRIATTSLPLLLALLATLVTGCPNNGSAGRPDTTGSSNTGDVHHDHVHPTEGPHHGELIELGNEEYHAEILHDDRSVTIYILDHTATTQVPIHATEIVINAKHDGQPVQFQLVAAPDENDPPESSSRFVSDNEELAQHLDEEGTDPRLVVTIDGKSFRGLIAHDHDHDGHDH